MPTKLAAKTNTRKLYLTTLWLSLFLGVFGADRFYLGKWRTGIIKLVTGGGLLIWLIIDSARIALGYVKDNQDRKLVGFTVNSVTVKMSALLLIATLTLTAVLDFLSKPPSSSSSSNLLLSNDQVLVISYIGFGALTGWVLFLMFTIVDAWRRNDILWTMVNILSFFFAFGLLNLVYYHFIRNKVDDRKA
jgi:TM2 domain-containing membrane protein YozV